MPEPTPSQGRFRRAVVPVSLGLGGLALMGAFVWAMFAGQREDVATARAFLTHVAEGEHSQAEALMSPALQTRVDAMALQRLFGQIEPWDHIGFSSRSTQGFGDVSETQLYGTGETISGCESTLEIQLENGLIEAFNITPLCPRTDTDA